MVYLTNWYKKSQSQFWGSAGAGIFFVCREDGTGLLLLRSEQVEQPKTWGISGGAMGQEDFVDPDSENNDYGFDEEDFWDAAKRETIEEIGYFPASFSIEGKTTYRRGSFNYITFIVNVPLVEKQKMQSGVQLNWESDEHRWFPINSLRGMKDLHFGVDYTLRNHKQFNGSEI